MLRCMNRGVTRRALTALSTSLPAAAASPRVAAAPPLSLQAARCFTKASAKADKEAAADESAEVGKDKEALERYVKFGFFAVFVAASAYFANGYAKKKYGNQDSGSVRTSVTTRGKPSLGGPFTLVTTEGEPVSQSQYLGKWTFFYFGFVHCPEICPVELNRMTKVVDNVRAAHPDGVGIQPMFVSCDPKRDSLSSIKEYLSVFHPDFVGLIGTPKQVNDACKSYRIYYSIPDATAKQTSDYLIDHSIAIFLFDPNGNFVDFFGNRYDENEITEKTLSYMKKLELDPQWTNW
jgi:protein SCO1/2